MFLEAAPLPAGLGLLGVRQNYIQPGVGVAGTGSGGSAIGGLELLRGSFRWNYTAPSDW
jgi:hypothetical protein